MRVDLHVHTYYSDGDLSPHEVVLLAKERGVEVVGIADHDTVDGVAEAIRAGCEIGVQVIAGVEITSMMPGRDLQQHILGYFIDWKNPELRRKLAEIRAEVFRLAEGRVAKLRELGFQVEMEDIRKYAPRGAPSATAIAKAVLNNPKNSNDPRLKRYYEGDRADKPYFNFYQDYFLPGGQAFVPTQSISSVEAIELVKRAGGVPVLAHPITLDDEGIEELAEAGLCGLEVYSSYHNEEQIRHFAQLAEKLSLIPTVGSDFHGESVKPDIELGCFKDYPEVFLEQLRKLAERFDQS